MYIVLYITTYTTAVLDLPVLPYYTVYYCISIYSTLFYWGSTAVNQKNRRSPCCVATNVRVVLFTPITRGTLLGCITSLALLRRPCQPVAKRPPAAARARARSRARARAHLVQGGTLRRKLRNRDHGRRRCSLKKSGGQRVNSRRNS